MKALARRIRGALGMGLTWAVGWALVGGAIEAIYNIFPGFPLGPLIDIWPIALAIPGFLAGTVFSLVLRIAARHRSFDQLSLLQFTAWGASGGLLLGGLAMVLGLGNDAPSLGIRAAVLLGPVTLLSSVSALGTLALARKARQPDLPQLRDGHASPSRFP